MGNLLSKPVVVKAVRAAVSLLGIDGVGGEDFKQIEKATRYAEDAFDRVSLQVSSGITHTIYIYIYPSIYLYTSNYIYIYRSG